MYSGFHSDFYGSNLDSKLENNESNIVKIWMLNLILVLIPLKQIVERKYLCPWFYIVIFNIKCCIYLLLHVSWCSIFLYNTALLTNGTFWSVLMYPNSLMVPQATYILWVFWSTRRIWDGAVWYQKWPNIYVKFYFVLICTLGMFRSILIKVAFFADWLKVIS